MQPAAKNKPLIEMLKYPVPRHANSILYMFGGISLVAFVILILSGIYLSQVYNPTPAGAHVSIVNAITNVPLADFARGWHFWTANLVVALLLLHIIRVFITGSYKKPRRLTWWTGVALLAITFAYIFIGTVLKYDQEGVEAVVHMQESFEFLGLKIGLINGGIPIITQLYAWHTTILTLLLLGLLATHMVLIKLRGISARPVRGSVAQATAGQGSSTFLAHLSRLSGFGLMFAALTGLLAVFLPAPIGSPGILGQEVTKPLWMFWPFYGLEDIFGLKGLLWGMAGFFAFLAAVPLVDRSPYLHWSKRKFMLGLGAIFLLATVGLGAYSKIRAAEQHIAPGAESSVMATAEPLNVSRQRLNQEAYYLMPTLVITGAAGFWLAYRPARR